MDQDGARGWSSLTDSTKTTVMVLVALVVVLVVAGIGVAAVRDATDKLRRVTVPTATTAPSGAQAGSTVPGSDLPPEQTHVVEEMKQQVADIRGLQWKGTLPIKVVSKEDLAKRVRDLNAKEIAKHRDQVTADEAVLKLLKLIPKDVDYAKAVDDILAGGVLGFYDDEAKELFVGAQSGTAPPDAATRSTLAHELTHALTDQNFDFGTRTKALDDQNKTEESAAFTALIEGDAELVRTLWEEKHLSADERLQAALGGTADTSAYDKAPEYLLQSLFFPYREGLAFVRSRYRAGGFGAVDDAYRRPPTSTENIIHPDTYTNGQPWTAPPVPDLATATGCGKVDTGTLGEFDMAQLLGESLSGSDAGRAAAGWNGDAYGVVRCGTAIGLGDRWQADDANEAGELADGLARWARGWSGSTRAPDADGRFTGPSGSGRIVRSGSRVDLVLADDAATADRVARALAAA